MWWHHSEMLAPLTLLISITVPFKWTEIEQKAFEVMKKIISRDVYLAYPDFNQYFDIHTNASDIQMGACISQNKKPIVFCSHKLNSAPKKCTTGEKELLYC